MPFFVLILALYCPINKEMIESTGLTTQSPGGDMENSRGWENSHLLALQMAESALFSLKGVAIRTGAHDVEKLEANPLTGEAEEGLFYVTGQTFDSEEFRCLCEMEPVSPGVWKPIRVDIRIQDTKTTEQLVARCWMEGDHVVIGT
jgi:hypothetical protein